MSVAIFSTEDQEVFNRRLGDQERPFLSQRIRSKLTVDLLVEKCIVVELKAVESLHPVHQAQVITYLKLTGCPAGLLLNFNATTLHAGLRRLDHPDRYAQKRRGRE